MLGLAVGAGAQAANTNGHDLDPTVATHLMAEMLGEGGGQGTEKGREGRRGTR